jgi:predicted amidohydrolase YtcJ
MSRIFLINGKIKTLDPAHAWAQALIVENGRIAALGDDTQVKSQAGPGDRIVDLAGRLALPGFTDSHIHLVNFALALTRIRLPEACSLAETLDMVRDAALKAKPGQWLQGRGLDESRWPEGRLPNRDDIDAVAPANPVFLTRRDGHLFVANSAALALAKVDERTPDPPGGALGRDQFGRLSGILMDKAKDLVADHIPPPTVEETCTALSQAIPRLHALGLTGVHDMRVWGWADGQLTFRALRHLHDQGRLTLRVWMNLPSERVSELISLGVKSGFGDDYLRLGHLKFFVDGSIGAATAWLLEPYETGGGQGLCFTDLTKLAADVAAADQAGLAVAVHAIGDRACREAIDLLVGLPRRHGPGPRHSLEHSQVVRPEDLARLAQTGAVASVQPIHLIEEMELHESRLGDRCCFAYPFRTILAAGVELAFGSDAPVADPNPIFGLHAAVTRCVRQDGPSQGWQGQERVGLEEAVRAYTLTPALITGRQKDLGSLVVGKLADLIILDRDIFNVPEEEIHQARVDLTMVGGEIVFTR